MWALLGGTIGRWVIGGLLAVVLAGGAWLGLRTYYYNIGWKAALAAVAAKDVKDVRWANEIAAEVAACFDSGGSWNVERNWLGETIGCEKPSQ